MARISKATRETTKTILVLIGVILLIICYVMYPLNRSKAFFARKDFDTFDAKVKLANDVTPLVAVGLTVDTFRVDADGLTSLNAFITPLPHARGTVVLTTWEQYDRVYFAPMVKELADSGFGVVLYDLRGSGGSSGKFASDGQLEMQDLEAIVSHLELHNQLAHPLIIAGYGPGADGALMAPSEEKRIDAVLAVDPVLTTDRLVNLRRAAHGSIWFPFWEPVIWWWYKIRSGYAIDFRENPMTQFPGKVMVVIPSDQMNDPAVVSVQSSVGPDHLRASSMPFDNHQAILSILALSRP
jgi:dienelactone hydrolase